MLTVCHAGLQVATMVRIEVEKTLRQQFQVTVASSDNTTTSSVKELICQMLGRL
jgi:galactitol-specific phosphotransferase system IIB component